MYIGIDLGGTKIGAGLIDEEGKLLLEKSIPTGVGRVYTDIVEDIVNICLQLINENNIKKNDVKALGIGVPGLGDKDGNVIYCVNLHWDNIPLGKILEKELGIPVFIGNDATVAALAEYECGAMKHSKCGVLLTLGTGVGGGIVFNGEVYDGCNGVTMEPGHMIVGENFYDCNCGRNGCLETFASSTAIIKYTEKLLTENSFNSEIDDTIEGDLGKLNAKIIFDCAKNGDEIAIKSVERLVKYLTVGIINIINLIDPEVIALGGGVSNAGEYLLNKVKEEVENNKYYKAFRTSKIVLAELGNKAGIIGAAMIAKHGIQ